MTIGSGSPAAMSGDPLRLDAKGVLVTGASRGIALGVAEETTQAGVRRVVLAARDESNRAESGPGAERGAKTHAPPESRQLPPGVTPRSQNPAGDETGAVTHQHRPTATLGE
jgi:NAD(P)-dependent dehydrogenase (short-subunit alcohol dehydrogenase family)